MSVLPVYSPAYLRSLDLPGDFKSMNRDGLRKSTLRLRVTAVNLHVSRHVNHRASESVQWKLSLDVTHPSVRSVILDPDQIMYCHICLVVSEARPVDPDPFLQPDLGTLHFKTPSDESKQPTVGQILDTLEREHFDKFEVDLKTYLGAFHWCYRVLLMFKENKWIPENSGNRATHYRASLQWQHQALIPEVEPEGSFYDPAPS